jgi:hypothetical protein
VHWRQAEGGDDRRQVVGVVPQPAGGIHRLRVGVAEPVLLLRTWAPQELAEIVVASLKARQ